MLTMQQQKGSRTISETEYVTSLISDETSMMYFDTSHWFVSERNVPFHMDPKVFWRVASAHRKWLRNHNIEYTLKQEIVDANHTDSIVESYRESAQPTDECDGPFSQSIEDEHSELWDDDPPSSA